MTFDRNIRLSNRTPKKTRMLTLYQANAPTMTPFSQEDKILIKSLYECKGYNARQLITGSKIRVIFGVRFERQKVDLKSKLTSKLKHANCILESF